MATTHSHFFRDVAQHIRFEWEPGSKWVDIYGPESDVPYTLAVSDFLALHADAEKLCRRIATVALQGQYGGNIFPLGQVGDWRLIPEEDCGR